MRLAQKKLLAYAIVLQVILACIVYSYYSSSPKPKPIWHCALKELGTATAGNGGAISEIPKILHQVFTSIFVFEKFKPLIESCLKLNPDWKYYLWTEDNTKALIDSHYPELNPAFELMHQMLERADVVRYIALHRFGGVYLDMDVECKKPLSPSIDNYTAFTGSEMKQHAQILYDLDFLATNAVMGSVPGHPFFRQIIDSLAAKREGFGDFMSTTGPIMLTRELRDYWNGANSKQYPVTLTPCYLFFPTMDENVIWNATCKKILDKASPGSATLTEAQKGCIHLKNRNWSLPRDMRPETVGQHHWMHLGHHLDDPMDRFNAENYFKDRIHFYVQESRCRLG